MLRFNHIVAAMCAIALLSGCMLARGLGLSAETRMAAGLGSGEGLATRGLSRSPVVEGAITRQSQTLGTRLGVVGVHQGRLNMSRVDGGHVFSVDGVRQGRVEVNNGRAMIFNSLDRPIATVFHRGTYVDVVGPEGWVQVRSVINGDRISHFSMLDGRPIGWDQILKNGQVVHYDPFGNLIGTAQLGISGTLTTGEIGILAAATLFGVFEDESSKNRRG